MTVLSCPVSVSKSTTWILCEFCPHRRETSHYRAIQKHGYVEKYANIIMNYMRRVRDLC